MTEALDNAVSEICNVLRAVSGLENVPLNPPENMSYTQFGIVYPMSGMISIGPVGTKRGLHAIAVDILRKRTDIARDLQALRPLIDTVSLALVSEMSQGGDRFNSSISTYSNLSYQWTTSDYAGIPVIGYHFLMNDVKLLIDL